MLAHKKISNFNLDLALGYKIKQNYFIEVNNIYSEPNSVSLNISNVAFGLENKSNKLLKVSAFSGFGVAFYGGSASFNFQLGANLGIRIRKNSSTGFKISNNFNKDFTSTAMNVYYRYNF
ncbi:hypothetical protein ASG01_05580 [Chryseobacterium sp. Leaf180]|nr:hypothetical protein ASG01_05580 [Chryseobacterium sp. Leaf180]